MLTLRNDHDLSSTSVVDPTPRLGGRLGSSPGPGPPVISARPIPAHFHLHPGFPIACDGIVVSGEARIPWEASPDINQEASE